MPAARAGRLRAAPPQSSGGWSALREVGGSTLPLSRQTPWRFPARGVQFRLERSQCRAHASRSPPAGDALEIFRPSGRLPSAFGTDECGQGTQALDGHIGPAPIEAQTRLASSTGDRPTEVSKIG